jgi:hypothetical protein
MCRVTTRGYTTDAVILSETGIVTADLASRSPLLTKFVVWAVSEVIPAFRRTKQQQPIEEKEMVASQKSTQSLPSPAHNTLTIANIHIRQDSQGRYCLNDLHRAAGGEKRHQPTDWLRTQQAVDLVAEVSTPGIPGVKTEEGRYGGTYVCKELVYAYAMWISAKFHLQVIRAYDALVAVPASQAASPFMETLANLQAQSLQLMQQLGMGQEELREKQEVMAGELEDTRLLEVADINGKHGVTYAHLPNRPVEDRGEKRVVEGETRSPALEGRGR